MGRRSKQSGGNLPLTNYEITRKITDYGTKEQRLAGHSQYRIGDCALTVNKLDGDAFCSPSGYLYNDAILEYLLQKTQELKASKEAYEKRQATSDSKEQTEETSKRLAQFQESQRTLKRTKTSETAKEAAAHDLRRVSYWLADVQPKEEGTGSSAEAAPPPDRPPSPMTGAPLRRKELLKVELKIDNGKLVCSVSDKPLTNGYAYWTDKSRPGRLVSEHVFDTLIGKAKRCPQTDQKIKVLRKLQASGSSFATSAQAVQVQSYRPTIT